jgi:phosphoribosylformylglycinamidine synthase
LASIEAAAKQFKIDFTVLGKVTEGSITVDGENWGSIASWKNSYDTSIENKLASK